MLQQLKQLADYRNLWVLTGAGCSTGSGIPAYRDDAGNWLYAQPIQHQQFLLEHRTRQRYWARSMLGWQTISAAIPNAAHHSLALLEARGRICQLVTQNVDGLHRQAGQQRLIELHGCLHQVFCLNCAKTYPRSDLQATLLQANPQWSTRAELAGPDGDIATADTFCDDFLVPQCKACGGVLKPAVVFFGDSVPTPKVEQAMADLQNADAMLVVGSSLQVYSGFRFVRAAQKWNIPVILINRGIGRADRLAHLRIEADCAVALEHLCRLTA